MIVGTTDGTVRWTDRKKNMALEYGVERLTNRFRVFRLVGSFCLFYLAATLATIGRKLSGRTSFSPCT